MVCVAVGWLVRVVVLVSDVGIRSVRKVFAVGWQLGVSCGRWVAVLGGPRGLAVDGVWRGQVGVGGVVIVGWVVAVSLVGVWVG